MAQVFLHAGLPKTGTTTIQTALDRHVGQLAGHGVLYPGGRQEVQRLAVFDLLGQRLEGDERQVAGSFGRLVDEIAAYDGRSVIVSEEILGMARPRQVRRLVEALHMHDVYVVISARDFGRTLVSAWQQTIVMGGTSTWQEFVDEVRSPGSGRASDGAGFFLRHDLLRVLDLWGTAVPPERIRLVIAPPPGARRTLLLERFAAAVDLPPDFFGEVPSANESLGAAELELLRRLNGPLTEKLKKRQYRHVIEMGLRPRWNGPDSRRLVLPSAEHAWAAEQARSLIDALERRGHPVFGDPSELLPLASPEGERRLDHVSETELLEAAEAAVVALAVAQGRLFSRFRSQFKEREGRAPSTAEVLGSTVRASSVRVKKRVLAEADRNRLLARAVRRYVSRRA